MAAKYYKTCENGQNLPEDEKKKKRQYAREQYRKPFIEGERNEEEKIKGVNMHAIYIIFFLKKEKTKGMNMHMKNIKTFLKKKKAKSVKILANDIEIFLKSIGFLC